MSTHTAVNTVCKLSCTRWHGPVGICKGEEGYCDVQTPC